MKVNAGSNKQSDPVPAGVHHAVCYAVIDLGTQDPGNPTFRPSRKVMILWELPYETIATDIVFGEGPVDAALMFAPPDAAHWLGTDALGRDVVSLLLAGARSSILVGVVAVSIGLSIGVALGLLAAAYPGWVEEALMRLTDFSFAFPAILVAILITAVLGPGMVNAILAIGFFNIPVFARITRGNAHAIWARNYVLAARACGKIRVLSCAQLFAETILRINRADSVSSLFVD